MAAPTLPVTILIGALGGEGGGVLAQWLIEAATASGFPAQSTSIPGVAQRTGATTYYVEILPVAAPGRRPVFSLNPVPGAIDLFVASELLEAVRQVGNGMSTVERTTVVSSTARVLTTLEKMQPTDGRIDRERLIAVLQANCRDCRLLDLDALARGAGSVISAVLFGVIADWGRRDGRLPLAADVCATVIRDSGIGVEASLRGFAAGYDAAAAAPGAVSSGVASSGPVDDAAVPAAVRTALPAAAWPMATLGWQRQREYQDDDYASLYLDRLCSVRDAELAGDPQADAAGWPTTCAVARYLALWMAFDDVIRVAQLKSAPARRQRIRDEVKAAPGDIVRVHDHFKPGVPELAALLPARWAERLVRWDRRRAATGRAPLALPLTLASDAIAGALALRAVAGLRRWRRHGSRYAQEQATIGRWLEAVCDGARLLPVLGLEIALCGRLIKGYGGTNDRGRENLLHVLDHLAAGATPARAAARAEAIRAARLAALADDAGKALDQALQSHGAPARPVAAVPIRFVRKPLSGRP